MDGAPEGCGEQAKGNRRSFDLFHTVRETSAQDDIFWGIKNTAAARNELPLCLL
jgi:hypothetical protein